LTHTLRAGNKEADRLANEAMDRGMGKLPGGGSGTGDPEGAGGTIKPTRKAGGGSGGSEPSRSTQPSHPRQERQVQERQVLEGYVKDGVVHLLGGELPDGIFVKVVRE
jgi:probable phosphoglycerate mutase